jgi:hypothetical protein
LSATANLWLAVRIAFGWVHQAAHFLGAEGVAGPTVRRQLGGLLGAMRRHRDQVGNLAEGIDHFLKVSRSYWPGLFACYDTPDLPRTNNDLERLFGSHRYHARRASGRKVASPALVLRGSVRVLAATATRQRPFSAAELGQVQRAAWRKLQKELGERQQRRVERRRFRRDAEDYLRSLEAKLTQSGLPP